MRVIVCGGGVVGACVAYFLSLRGVEVVVVESTGVANAASGKSGGFLALDWCDGSPLAALARRSFALHAQLAALPGSDWGYRRLESVGVVASARRGFGHLRRLPLSDWLAPEAAVHARLGTPETTAQIHPAAFTRGMMGRSLAQGARLVSGAVTGMERTAAGGAVAGVRIGEDLLPADAVVIAMGPWSSLAARWLPLPPIYALKGHSVLLVHESARPPQAAFVEYEAQDGAIQSPEIFPRPDGTTYVCGLSTQTALPANPAAVTPDPGACEQLLAITAGFAPDLGSAPLLAAQACFRPVVEDGLPLIGTIGGVDGAYIATGHGVWGMLNAPATGETLAELIIGGAAETVDLSPFRPSRLATAAR